MPCDLPAVAERFHAIASQILNATDLPVDPWLYQYCGVNADPAGATRYVRHQLDLIALTGASAENAVVVDAGCGFGFTMIVYALLGARRVLGVERHSGMVSTVQAYIPLLPADVAARIEISQGDVTAMPYEDASADILLSIEAISHYLHVDTFLGEAVRVLRPGGLLVIADGNNASNFLVRRRTYEIWEAFEQGPEGRHVHGHVVGEPYVERRRRILATAFPALPEETLAEIAARTAGFTEEQVIAAGREYGESGVVPSSPYRKGQLAIAPDGAAMERLFVPRQLARALERRGFKAKAYGYWGGASGRSSVRIANSVLAGLSPLTTPLAPAFRVIAQK